MKTMNQINIPFVAIHNKGLEINNISKTYSKKKLLIMFLSNLTEESQLLYSDRMVQEKQLFLYDYGFNWS